MIVASQAAKPAMPLPGKADAPVPPPDLLQLLWCNPWRPADAWYQRARGIFNDGQPQATVNLDGTKGCFWIRQAQRFLFALSEARSFDEHVRVMIDFQELYRAYWIHQGQKTNDQATRWAIEARILARQTNAEIAEANGCSPGTIAAYEALYFNVRERLEYKDFVLNHVVGPGMDHDSRRAVARIWKLFGYLGGQHVLNAIIAGVPDVGCPNRPEEVAGYFKNLAIATVRQKAAVASLLAQVDGMAHSHLVKSFAKCVEIERASESVDPATDKIQDNLQALLASLPFQASDPTDPEQLPAYDRAAAELRSDERMLAAAGVRLPGLEALRQLQFPERASR